MVLPSPGTAERENKKRTYVRTRRGPESFWRVTRRWLAGQRVRVMDKELLSQLPIILSAVAGVFTALATLVWAFRRKP